MNPFDPRIQRWLPFACVLAMLLVGGLSFDPLPMTFSQQDKLQHLIGFIVFSVTLRHALPQMELGHLLVVGLMLSGGIELCQGFLPQRTASLGDIAADLAGVWLGWGCSMLLRPSRTP
jgi:VanZ family protein